MAYNEYTRGTRILISSQTASASSSITFTSGVTGYDLYEIDCYSVIQSNTTNTELQLSTDAGGTWVNTAYYLAGFAVQSDGSTGAYNQANGSSCLVDTGVTNSTTTPWTCYIRLATLGSGSLHKIITFTATSGQNNNYWKSASCVLQNTTAMTGIKIFPSAGTFTSGSFKLYGIRN